MTWLPLMLQWQDARCSGLVTRGRGNYGQQSEVRGQMTSRSGSKKQETIDRVKEIGSRTQGWGLQSTFSKTDIRRRRQQKTSNIRKRGQQASVNKNETIHRLREQEGGGLQLIRIGPEARDRVHVNTGVESKCRIYETARMVQCKMKEAQNGCKGITTVNTIVKKTDKQDCCKCTTENRYGARKHRKGYSQSSKCMQLFNKLKMCTVSQDEWIGLVYGTF